MKTLWTININDQDYFPPNHNLKPVIWKNKLFYTFKTIDKSKIDLNGLYTTKICILEVNLKNTETNYKEFSISHIIKKVKIYSSENWKYIISETTLKLDIGIMLNISDNEIIPDYEQTKLEEFKVKSEYQFENKVLKYNQRSKLECYDKSSKKLIWEQKIKGYIYTEIEQWENFIFFGTAGKGGAFYCISLDKGEKLTEYINGDASEFSWFKENIIIKDIKGNLAKINAKSGETIEELKLKNKISYYSPILVDGNKIFARVFDKKENLPKLICVEI
ncbi:hypothetical protein FLBR109950_08015 [Flavobacterium branchiophilum]|uniref:Uncharacterized protein n=1 Tax=Flavobacterium branchiophilum (strain FL-15) TaxID=1034807 RepID=G2Z0E9_FLABF|nr:hypothetical protein [Flavobacterium branchiophilum]CCB69340.1 Hypothetical protein FBFL15_1256 [Flavobacterium branchiophilum FL-15]